MQYVWLIFFLGCAIYLFTQARNLLGKQVFNGLVSLVAGYAFFYLLIQIIIKLIG